MSLPESSLGLPGAGGEGGVSRPRTQLPVPPAGNLKDHPLDEELQVAEEDEGRRSRRAAMVFLDQVVPLELPDLVRVLLHLLERVAGERRGERRGVRGQGPSSWGRCASGPPGGQGHSPRLCIDPAQAWTQLG